MTFYKLFSEREKEEQNKNEPEIYEYKTFNKAFRNQFLHAISDAFEGGNPRPYSYDFWLPTCATFAREKGLKAIYASDYYNKNNKNAFENYVDTCSDIDFRDLLDLVLSLIDGSYRKYLKQDTPDNFVEEINYRLKQHHLGYEFINHNLIKKSNEHLYNSAIKPTLNLLHGDEFKGPENEFLTAFECYNDGKNKEAISNASKAFESTLKVICTGMEYGLDNQNDKAKELLRRLENNNFYPSYLQNHLTHIEIILENGAPNIRNNEPGVDHGQGPDIKNINDYCVEYMLNIVASNILFLVQIYKQKKNEQTNDKNLGNLENK